ncbi:hypothetical protein NXS98_01340 [Fontisphaera persica]|uniref:hypothetical protein n=1 Tax=Fontisphaera persica TaxID=2974023 RepID=UPI0024BF1EF8|nr:hypothetical protein [Fontisphaera persica]WCJ59791.1 hypothetical protein NXS98_01340 [Fontisphaera persica]
MRTNRHWLRKSSPPSPGPTASKPPSAPSAPTTATSPPKRYTWQSGVETVHRLVKDEFFDRETFSSPQDFWAKVTTYWLYFNLFRPNGGKGWQSPFQIFNASAPALARALLDWRHLNLSQLHHLHLSPPLHRGHDLLSFPKRCQGCP